MTREEFSNLSDEEAKAYQMAELRNIVSAETAANKELGDTVEGVRLPNIAERMLKRFKK
jgi:hypothetical protein